MEDTRGYDQSSESFCEVIMVPLLILCGPTASGKTNLACMLAKRYNGEVISADSRQVYRGMDIGTGKDLDRNFKFKISNLKFQNNVYIGYRTKDGVKVWLVDMVDPSYSFHVRDFVRSAELVLHDMWSRSVLPIIVGGTGFYITSLLSPPETLDIPVDLSWRKESETYSTEMLQDMLITKDPDVFQKMNDSDRKNPRRLIRAIEVAMWKEEPSLSSLRSSPSGDDSMMISKDECNVHTIGCFADTHVLRRRIDHRVGERYEQGVIEEISSLLRAGYTWDLPSFSACGYGVWKPWFEKRVSTDEVLQAWKRQEYQYAKRQMTWFKKQQDIHWVDVSSPDYLPSVCAQVEEWYTL